MCSGHKDCSSELHPPVKSENTTVVASQNSMLPLLFCEGTLRPHTTIIASQNSMFPLFIEGTLRAQQFWTGSFVELAFPYSLDGHIYWKETLSSGS